MGRLLNSKLAHCDMKLKSNWLKTAEKRALSRGAPSATRPPLHSRGYGKIPYGTRGFSWPPEISQKRTRAERMRNQAHSVTHFLAHFVLPPFPLPTH